ncbi:MAG: TonB-dependent receptor [Methylacidiphilales bacterium]|nr:TonB-dependent receptor [Candidatus Methylacidiphilales bacterium]
MIGVSHALVPSSPPPQDPNSSSTSADSATEANDATPQNPDPAQGPDNFKQMSLSELMDQEVISVSKTPEPLAQAPAAIQIITNDEVRRSGATSLPEALRLADNLEVAQGNAYDWHISARGFNTQLSDKLLVLIDGRTVYTPLYSGVNWDVQSVMLEDLDRIEVVSGPGGTLWGANAMNGVINIVTKDAKETQGWFVDGGGGTELQEFGDVRYGGKLAPDVYYRVYGTYFNYNGEVDTSGNSLNDSWSQFRSGFRMDAAATSDDKVTLQGDYYNGLANVPKSVYTTQLQEGGNVLTRWVHTISDDSDTNLQLYYDRTYLTQPEPMGPFGAPPGVFKDDLSTYDLEFQHHFSVGERNKIVWGLGYRLTNEVDQNSPSVQVDPTILNQNLYSAFAQDEIEIQKNLFFTLGTKVEHNDYTGFEFEPSGRIQWNVAPKHMIWAAVSRAVRTPSRLDRDLNEPSGLPPIFHIPSLLVGSSQFVSETLIAYELGYRAQVTDQISGSISTFYNDYNDIRSVAPVGGPATLGLPLAFQNNLEGNTYGAELSADYQMLDWWRWHAGYDYLKEQIHVKPGETDFNNGTNETADPENQFSLRSSMDLPQNIEFDTALRWVDRLCGPDTATVPSYMELDARLGWHVTKDLEISVVGQNLLHDYHQEYSSEGEAIVRSVYGKISWHF